MRIENIPIEITGKFSRIIIDYCKSSEPLKDFIVDDVSIENFKKKLKDTVFSDEKRQLLVRCIEEQYSQLSLPVNSNVKKLLNSNAYTITTGHQLCLFGGPQYFVSKIVSVIKLCSQLKKESPENEYIPVFWMASEDHDFDEINSVKLFGKELKTEKSGKGPVGRIKASLFADQLTALKEIVGDSENAKELIRIFQNAYSGNNTLAQATLIWINELFSDYDLVIMDGDDPLLKKSFSPVIKNELIQRKSIDYINASSQKLIDSGYHKQVNPREINLFYIEDGLRERIVFENGKFKVLNTDREFTENEILSQLEKFPEKFSPNAIFRPLYQESILPNLAYIGGPGELAYWFQLKANFDRLEISFPLLVLRDSFVKLKQKQYNQFVQFGFSFEDVFKHIDELNALYLKSVSEGELHFEAEEKLLATLKDQLLDKVKGVDQSLIGMVQAEMKGIENLFSKLEKKLIKAQKNREEVSINQIRKFRNTVLPNDVLVERTESFIPNYLSHGKDYIASLMNNSNVFQPELKVIIQ